MAISDTIQSMYNNVDSAYTSLANKGATIPANKNLANLADSIDSIPAGGGPSGEDVIFYDYDGTVVQSYSKADFLALTAMPENPSHTGLVAQGWNWSLSDAKTYVTDYGKLNVGQMYKTASGLTEFDIELTKVTGLTITFKMAGTTNWGDGTSGTTTSSSTHTYASYGKYTITCDGTRLPQYVFGSSTSYYCTNVRVGENVTTLEQLTLAYCRSIKTITLANSVTSMGTNVFEGIYSFISIIIPTSITSIPQQAFSDCSNLVFVALPNGVTSIGNYAFSSCSGLTSITIPNGVTSIGDYTFYYCYGLKSITIPNSVRSIRNYAFSNCYSNLLYDFSEATSVPTLNNTNAFQNINALCKIVVPDALYNTWITASQWTAYANYIYKASEVQ